MTFAWQQVGVELASESIAGGRGRGALGIGGRAVRSRWDNNTLLWRAGGCDGRAQNASWPAIALPCRHSSHAECANIADTLLATTVHTMSPPPCKRHPSKTLRYVRRKHNQPIQSIHQSMAREALVRNKQYCQSIIHQSVQSLQHIFHLLL